MDQGLDPVHSSRLTRRFLFPVANSNYDGNYNKSVTLPATAQTGSATFTASLESLYGVEYEPALYPFNVSFTVGGETSTDYVFVGLS